jgi:adenylosuccinate synthase
MKVDVLLGLQWGDEGKGKIVDVLTPKYDVVARFQGGPNAGHTLEFNEIKHVLHTIPSGIFRSNQINIIGNGVVIDPIIFQKEIDKLNALKVDITNRLVISKKAHLILPSHRILDAASEASKGKTKIGSTLKGIGPTYMDKTGRNGLRIGDILLPDFKDKYNTLLQKHQELLKLYNFEYKLSDFENGWFDGIELLKKYKIVDSEHLLDIDFGSYPFVTSSNTICAGACTGLGIAPNKIGEVLGIFKAYCTRVGSGPFPTELNDKTGELIREKGREFGATTGRPRRCGWLDLPALQYAIMLNGVTQLIMMKADVLSGFDKIKVATGYKLSSGEVTKDFPYDLETVTGIIYDELDGWKEEDLNGIRNIQQIPPQLKKYMEYIEAKTKLPISIISLGPNREQTIILR